MSNFALMPSDYAEIAESAKRAESHIHGDPLAACFHARFPLESIVHWLYRHDAGLRMHQAAVERFQSRAAWETLSESDSATLHSEIAGFPAEVKPEKVESRLFDLTVLRMQLALTEGDISGYERHRQKVVEIAMLLEAKGDTIPAIRAQLAYLSAMQDTTYWDGITPAAHSAFSQFLTDRSLTAAQIRFIEMVIEQLTQRGVMDASALYEPPFSHLHAGGPDALFAGKEQMIDGVFEALKRVMPRVRSA